jgi:hypothetical protein
MADETITVSGVTFNAEQVVSVTIKVNNREIHINKVEKEKNKIGFSS